MKLSIQNEVEALETLNNSFEFISSIWFWIAIFEFAIIAILILQLKRKKQNLDFGNITKSKLKTVKKASVDMDNLMNSINSSKGLYKELSRLCHPDRFINSNKGRIAEEIFQEISMNRRDFNKLSNLKERAKNELNINF